MLGYLFIEKNHKIIIILNVITNIIILIIITKIFNINNIIKMIQYKFSQKIFKFIIININDV